MRAQLIRMIHSGNGIGCQGLQFSTADNTDFTLAVFRFFRQVGKRIRVEKNEFFKTVRIPVAAHQRNITTQGMSTYECFVYQTFIQYITDNIRTEFHRIDALAVSSCRRIIGQSVSGQIQANHAILLFQQCRKFRPDIKGFQVAVQENDNRLASSPLRVIFRIAKMDGNTAGGCEILHNKQCFSFCIATKIDNFQKLGIISDF